MHDCSSSKTVLLTTTDMLYNLLASRPLVMLPTCWQHVANMFAKWSLGLRARCTKAVPISVQPNLVHRWSEILTEFKSHYTAPTWTWFTWQWNSWSTIWIVPLYCTLATLIQCLSSEPSPWSNLNSVQISDHRWTRSAEPRFERLWSHCWVPSTTVVDLAVEKYEDVEKNFSQIQFDYDHICFNFWFVDVIMMC